MRRVQFQEPIFPEPEEIGPFPPEHSQANGRTRRAERHSKKRLLHRYSPDKPTDNRDFILSLSADIVHYVSQLRNSREDTR